MFDNLVLPALIRSASTLLEASGGSKATPHCEFVDHTTDPNAATVSILISSSCPFAGRFAPLSRMPVLDRSATTAVRVLVKVITTASIGIWLRGDDLRPPPPDLPNHAYTHPSARIVPLPAAIQNNAS